MRAADAHTRRTHSLPECAIAVRASDMSLTRSVFDITSVFDFTCNLSLARSVLDMSCCVKGLNGLVAKIAGSDKVSLPVDRNADVEMRVRDEYVTNHTTTGLLLRSVTLLQHLSSRVCERERLQLSSRCWSSSRRELACLSSRTCLPLVGGARGAVSARARAEACEAVLVARNSTPLLPKQSRQLLERTRSMCMYMPSARSRCACSFPRSATTRRTAVPTLLALLVQKWYKSTRTDTASAGAWVTAARAMLLVGSVPVTRHQKTVLEYHQRAQRGGLCACEAATEGRANRVSRAALGGVVLADDEAHEWNDYARIDLILEGQLAAPHLTTSPPHYYHRMPVSFSSQAYIYVYTSYL